MASSSSSSSLLPGSNPPKYDVFLSFRGEDTRNYFTSHLNAALCRSGIQTFIDDCEVRKGDEISSSLSNAIQSSSLSIIIFSKHYASSLWCLNELLEILECNKTSGQIILPVFYHVSPSDIRKQTGTYGEAFAEHEKRFKKTTDKVQKWRAALTQVANLSGWDLKKHDWPEFDFVDKIVQDVVNRLNHMSSGDHLDGFVGIASRMKKVESLLCIGMSDIHIIGIWGMGGIGKTTIARAVYYQFANQFESSCFLENVRDVAKKEPNHLQEKLLFKILDKQNLNVKAFTFSRLRRKKILIVLDDVDDSEHLQFLVGHHSLLGPGSRIIITSRDKQVLKNGNVNVLYELDGLNYHEALQLFSRNAFKQSYPPEDYMKLSIQVINYANGNPLALQVLGCFLHGRTKLEWKSSLYKLKKCPNLKIQNVLRISFDGLDEQEQEIFLFIACFFKGEERDRVIAILDGFGLFTEIGISVLVDKCLLTIIENKLLMHDLIQEMGHGIVFQESIKPGERSRLWDPQEICNLFKRNTGTSAVQSISLDLSQISELYISPDAFTRMPELRLLKFYTSSTYNWHKDIDAVQICEGLESLPDELRYLYWHGYPLKSLPLKFNPEHLVELDVRDSNVEYLWKDTKFLGNLRQIGLFNCEQLTEVPDLSRTPNLQIMQLHSCSCLTKFPKISCNLRRIYLTGIAIEEVPNSAIKSLNKLISLHIHCCTRLKNLPGMHHLTSLKTLSLKGCSNFMEFPKVSEEIKYLFLNETDIEEVPKSAMEPLNKLVYLNICGNTRLKSLPSMRHLTSLRSLDVSGCSNFTKFPEIPGEIIHLSFCGTAIEEVPDSAVGSLNKLLSLNFSDCTRLKNLPASLHHLPSLHLLYLNGCSNFTFPEILEETTKELLKVDMPHDCNDKQWRRWEVKSLLAVLEINIIHCGRWKLEALPEVLEIEGNLDLPSFRDSIDRLFDQEKVPCSCNIWTPISSCSSHISNLLKIDQYGCFRVEKLLEKLYSSLSLSWFLWELNLSECNMLVLPSGLSRLSSLIILRLNGNKFESLSLKHFTSLRRLDISYCERLQDLQDFPSPSRLDHLDASHCISLETLPNIVVDSTEKIRDVQHFKYFNCLKLDENACLNIEEDARLMIQLMANQTNPDQLSIEESNIAGDPWESVNFNFPGSEIPKWFCYRNEGYSITINLPPHWCSDKLVGLVLCFVASCESSNHDMFSVSCNYNFIDCNMQKQLAGSSDYFSAVPSKSDHVLLQFRTYSFREYSFCQKVQFDFLVHASPHHYCCKVKKCGIHLVYSESEDEITESRDEIANEDQASESEVNTVSRLAQGIANVIVKPIFLVGLAFSFFFSFKNRKHY